jgi:hypothetical protein
MRRPERSTRLDHISKPMVAKKQGIEDSQWVCVTFKP